MNPLWVPERYEEDQHGLLIIITSGSQTQPDGPRRSDCAGRNVSGGPIHPRLGHWENVAGLAGDYRNPETGGLHASASPSEGTTGLNESTRAQGAGRKL